MMMPTDINWTIELIRRLDLAADPRNVVGVRIDRELKR